MDLIKLENLEEIDPSQITFDTPFTVQDILNYPKAKWNWNIVFEKIKDMLNIIESNINLDWDFYHLSTFPNIGYLMNKYPEKSWNSDTMFAYNYPFVSLLMNLLSHEFSN